MTKNMFLFVLTIRIKILLNLNLVEDGMQKISYGISRKTFIIKISVKLIN